MRTMYVVIPIFEKRRRFTIHFVGCVHRHSDYASTTQDDPPRFTPFNLLRFGLDAIRRQPRSIHFDVSLQRPLTSTRQEPPRLPHPTSNSFTGSPTRRASSSYFIFDPFFAQRSFDFFLISQDLRYTESAITLRLDPLHAEDIARRQGNEKVASGGSRGIIESVGDC